MNQDQRIATVQQEMRTDGSWRQLERYATELARGGQDDLAKLLLKEKVTTRPRVDPQRRSIPGHRHFQGNWRDEDYRMRPGKIIHGHPVFLGYGEDAGATTDDDFVHSNGNDGVFVGFAIHNAVCLEGWDKTICVRRPAGPDAQVQTYFWPLLNPDDEGKDVTINSPMTMRVLVYKMIFEPIGTVATVLNERLAWVRISEPEDGR